jgi:hypothetical protein
LTVKEKVVKRITFISNYVFDLVGENCGIFPGNKLRLCYNDTTNKVMVIEDTVINVSDNPVTGKTDVTIKLTLDKEVYKDETNCL